MSEMISFEEWDGELMTAQEREADGEMLAQAGFVRLPGNNEFSEFDCPQTLAIRNTLIGGKLCRCGGVLERAAYNWSVDYILQRFYGETRPAKPQLWAFDYPPIRPATTTVLGWEAIPLAHKVRNQKLRRLWLVPLIVRQRALCGICGFILSECASDIHLDHKIPLARGGRDEVVNLHAVHAACNLAKGVH